MYFYLSKLLAPLLNPSNLIFIGLITSIFLFLKFKNKLTKFLLIFFSSIFLIFVFLPIGKTGIKILEKKYINKHINLEYKNIVVLAGAESIFLTKNTNILNLNDSSERLIASVELALKNKNAKIIYLGGSGFLQNENLNEVDVAKMFYNNIGFNLDRIQFVGSTRNTIENLSEFKKLQLNQPGDLLITSAFHMNRALLISEKLKLNLTPYAVDFKKSSGDEKLLNLYQTFNIVDNFSSLNLFFREFLGIIVVKLIL